MSETRFDPSVVHSVYEELGFQSGWTFLCCHEDRLHDARVAIVGLNPGGRDDEGPYGEQWATGKNAYYSEYWGNGEKEYDRLQHQIHRWHTMAGVGPEETLCAQFVPFRTRDWDGIKDRADRQLREAKVLQFSRELWNWVIATSRLRTFITMGKVPGREIAALLGAPGPVSMDTGWGTAKIDVYVADDGRKVIAMPHPSRFTLFDRGVLSEIAEQNFQSALKM